MAIQRPLKGVFEFTDRFRHVPLAVLLGVWLAATALAAWANAWLSLVFGVLALADGASLAALPRFERSFGPPQLPWLALLTLRLALALGASRLPDPWALATGVSLEAALSLAATYACWIEPFRLGVTRVALRSSRLNGFAPLRLLHISDLHVERITARERRLLEWVEQLLPDVIVITGDYLNISYTYDETAQRQTREWLARLRAPGGVFAIQGSPLVDPPEVLARVLDAPNLTWLRDEMAPLTWRGHHLQIMGVTCSYDMASDVQKLAHLLDGRDNGRFTLLLYHTPDVMPEAVEAGVDLYLAGHTHGGQVRLPGFGALVTASIYWKRYEMGLYREQATTLYVSRGLGLEGKGAPRARFLCPPEVTLFTLTGDDGVG
jgi:hypothetical protein